MPQWLLGIKLWWQGWITAAGTSSLAGVLGAVYAWWGHSGSDKQPPPDISRLEKLGRQIAEKLLGPVFLLGLATGLSLIIAWRLNQFQPFDQIRFLLLCSNTDFMWLSWRWLILLGASFGAGYFVSANRFSMQSLYRNRLIRAYLGRIAHSQAEPVYGFRPRGQLPDDANSRRRSHFTSSTWR